MAGTATKLKPCIYFNWHYTHCTDIKKEWDFNCVVLPTITDIFDTLHGHICNPEDIWSGLPFWSYIAFWEN